MGTACAWPVASSEYCITAIQVPSHGETLVIIVFTCLRVQGHHSIPESSFHFCVLRCETDRHRRTGPPAAAPRTRGGPDPAGRAAEPAGRISQRGGIFAMFGSGPGCMPAVHAVSTLYGLWRLDSAHSRGRGSLS